MDAAALADAGAGGTATRDARLEPAPADAMISDAGGAAHDVGQSGGDGATSPTDGGRDDDAGPHRDGGSSDDGGGAPDGMVSARDAAHARPDAIAPDADADAPGFVDAGLTTDAGSVPTDVGPPHADAGPEPDAALPARDAAELEPDAASPPVDAEALEPDAASPPVDAEVLERDAAAPPVDAQVVEPDAASPPVDAEVLEPDAASPPVDAEVLEPDAAAPPVDAQVLERDAAAPPVDAQVSEPDAAAEPLEPRTALAGPFPLDGAALGRLDIVWDALAVSPDGALAAAAYKVTGAPAQSRLGLWTADGAARLWLSEDPVWSEGCDFHPDGDRIYCAHQPRPQWGVTDLLVLDATDGSTLARVPVPTVDPDPQPEPYWGDAVRVSPDGRWVAMAQQSARLGRGQVVVFEIPAAHAAAPARVAAFAAENPDEVAFGLDSDSLYASAFIGPHILRAVLDPGGWVLDGLRMVDTSVAGLDVDGLDRAVVTGWDSARVLIVDPHAGRAWGDAPIVRARVAGTSYELCADGRPGAPWAWSIAHGDGAVPVHAIDTDTGDILAAGTVSPAQTDGVAMSCARDTGQPFIVTRGRLWTWEVAQ
jgi:hypothetical protein